MCCSSEKPQLQGGTLCCTRQPRTQAWVERAQVCKEPHSQLGTSSGRPWCRFRCRPLPGAQNQTGPPETTCGSGGHPAAVTSHTCGLLVCGRQGEQGSRVTETETTHIRTGCMQCCPAAACWLSCCHVLGSVAQLGGGAPKLSQLPVPLPVLSCHHAACMLRGMSALQLLEGLGPPCKACCLHVQHTLVCCF